MDAYGVQYAHPFGMGGVAAYLQLKMIFIGIPVSMFPLKASF